LFSAFFFDSGASHLFVFRFSSHQTVKGLYAWCQGCSHGGHLIHMREWFIRDWLGETPVCPTGCGHDCEITAAELEDGTLHIMP